MKYTAKQFTSMIEGIALKSVSPALTRSLFPVREDETYNANVEFYKHKDSLLKGKWEPVGTANEFDKYGHSIEVATNPVYQRLVAIDMTLFDVKQAEAGNTLSLDQQTTDVFNILEREIDNLTFNGNDLLKGLTDDSLYGDDKGTSIASTSLFTSSDIENDAIVKVFADVIMKSSKDGTYQAPKQLLVPPNVLSMLRTRNYNGLPLITYLQNIFSEVGSIRAVPGIKNIFAYERNESHIYAHFTFPLQQVGDVESHAGGIKAYYMSAYAGLVVRNADTLVRVTNVLESNK